MREKTGKITSGRITIFAVCILLGFLLALQFKSVKLHAKTAAQPARNEELSQLLSEEREKNQALSSQLDQYKSDVDKFRQEAQESGGYAATLTEQLKRAELLAGNTAVHGPGVTVTLKDSAATNTSGTDENAFVVHDSDLLRVINELRAAGAEAISLNGERVLATSEIRCAGPTVSINNTRYAAPFVIKAIGDPATMEQSLLMRGGIVDELMTFEIDVNIVKSDDLVVEASRRNIAFQHAQPVEEGQ